MFRNIFISAVSVLLSFFVLHVSTHGKRVFTAFLDTWESDGQYQGSYPGKDLHGVQPKCRDKGIIDAVRKMTEYGVDLVAFESSDRESFYRQYLQLNDSQCRFQTGVEIGALHNPAPVPATCKGGMTYYDAIDQATAQSFYPEQDRSHIVKVGIIGDANVMSNVNDNQFDFLIASHVIEHMHLPVTAVKNWIRVIRPGGYVFVIAPHMCTTFDRFRLATGWKHFIEEEMADSETKQKYFEEHLREWSLSHLGSHFKGKGFPPAPLYHQVEDHFLKKANDSEFVQKGGMHYHAWDRASLVDFFWRLSQKDISGDFSVSMRVKAMGFRQDDMLVVLEKVTAS